MKIVTPSQMSDLESQAYRDGSSETDFMDEAGSGVALVVHDLAELEELDHQIILLCGKGNNAGDAYVAGLHLLHLDYDVIAYQLFPIAECSQLCRESHFQFLNEGGRVVETPSPDEINFPSSGIIIDGIFGTGFHGTINEHISAVIKRANESHIPIVAVDIPSGLNGETGAISGTAILAHTTAFLGLPKIGFFLLNSWNQVGKLVYVDFGLPRKYIDSAETEFIMLSPDMLKPLMPPLVRNRHKYQAGHVVGLAGSPAYPGASVLSSLAALCSGAGIIHLLHPENMKVELAFGPYELIRVPYSPDDSEKILELMNEASATFIGPGLGRSPTTSKILRKVIPKLTKPCVIDADALTILSEGEIPLPSNTILTPHLGELKRLFHITNAEINAEFLEKCRDYATEKKITLVLKGGPSFIFHPNEPIMVNPRGDPGMATAGTGDILTGLIASLLAQGLTTHHAACLGVYIHAVAGEWAAAGLTSYCMTATDIISYFPDAFQPNNWTK
jgi:hydroxyethylthiazole kinase-like uncharacterized protein yjeF